MKERGSAWENGLDGDEGLCVDDGGVVRGPACGGEGFLCGGLDFGGVALTRVDCGLGLTDGAREGEGGGAVLGGEVGVAGGEGEAVGVADDGGADNLDGEVEVTDHAADDGNLLEVFLAEDGDVGLDDVEEFGNDGADAAEVGGALGAFEGLGEEGFLDPSGVILRVEVGGVGEEDGVGAFGLAEGEVVLLAAGVGVVILVGGELGGVDEDGDDDAVAALLGQADEGEVALVEAAHGGDEADDAAEAFLGGAPGVEFGGTVEGIHGD